MGELPRQRERLGKQRGLVAVDPRGRPGERVEGNVAFERHRLAAAVRADLGSVASATPLEDAWQMYEAMLSVAHAFDLRQVSAVEAAFEEPADQYINGSLPRRLETVTEVIETDLADSWARLRARSLVDALRESGDSLRSIGGDVQVSAPYLSQLSGGTGPVPSDRVLRKLEEGVAKRGLRVPSSPPSPHEILSALKARLEIARENLADVHARHLPQVRVEGVDSGQARMLEGLFVSLATRLADSHEGLAFKHLLDEIVATDSHNLVTMLKVLQNDDLLKVHHRVVALPANAQVALGALLQAMESNESTDVLRSRPSKARLNADHYSKSTLDE